MIKKTYAKEMKIKDGAKSKTLSAIEVLSDIKILGYFRREIRPEK